MKTKIILTALTAMMITHDGLNAQTAKAPKKMLVAYFSHSGNTRTVAEQIREATGADIFEIEPAAAYPTNYQAVVDQAKKEVNSGFKPALKSKPENLGKYDIIFVGSPCWWYTIAPPVATFLSSYDLSGKTIAPFMTHEGSRMGHSEADIKKLCAGATLLPGLPVPGRQRARGRSGSGQMVAKNRSDRINFIILPRGHRHDNKSTITSGVHGTFPHSDGPNSTDIYSRKHQGLARMIEPGFRQTIYTFVVMNATFTFLTPATG